MSVQKIASFYANPVRSRGMIGVQPTSVSRRRPNLPHGHKRLAAGRPAGSKKDGFSAARRKRCLAINVQNNKPNALIFFVFGGKMNDFVLLHSIRFYSFSDD